MSTLPHIMCLSHLRSGVDGARACSADDMLGLLSQDSAGWAQSLFSDPHRGSCQECADRQLAADMAAAQKQRSTAKVLTACSLIDMLDLQGRALIHHKLYPHSVSPRTPSAGPGDASSSLLCLRSEHP